MIHFFSLSCFIAFPFVLFPRDCVWSCLEFREVIKSCNLTSKRKRCPGLILKEGEEGGYVPCRGSKPNRFEMEECPAFLQHVFTNHTNSLCTAIPQNLSDALRIMLCESEALWPLCNVALLCRIAVSMLLWQHRLDEFLLIAGGEIKSWLLYSSSSSAHTS